jgi:hypothetical protein
MGYLLIIIYKGVWLQESLYIFSLLFLNITHAHRPRLRMRESGFDSSYEGLCMNRSAQSGAKISRTFCLCTGAFGKKPRGYVLSKRQGILRNRWPIGPKLECGFPGPSSIPSRFFPLY